MKVRPNYVNPLTMMKQNKNVPSVKQAAQAIGKKSEGDDVLKLETKQQTLQNQLLLMKSQTTTGAMSKEVQQSLEKQIEEVVNEIQTAKSKGDTSAITDSAVTSSHPDTEKISAGSDSTPYVSSRSSYDLYEKGGEGMNTVLRCKCGATVKRA